MVQHRLRTIGLAGRHYESVKSPSSCSSVATATELLDALEWRRFEELVTWYFQTTGFDAKRSRVGADGGVDILLSNHGESSPVGR